MENNIDTYGFYKRSDDSFVRWNNNDPAYLRRLTAIKHDVQYNSSDVITIEVDSIRPISECIVGDYVIHAYCTFRLNQNPAIVKTGERIFHYTYTFESVKYELINALFILPADEIVTDDYTGTMYEFLKMLVENANRVFGTQAEPYPWRLPVDGNNQWDNGWHGTAYLPIEARTLQYSEKNCLYVLQNIIEEWGENKQKYTFSITENAGIKTIDILEYEKTVHVIDIYDANTDSHSPFEYGNGKGLYKIERTASNNENVITRLFAFGSSENLPIMYFAPKLGLPKARSENSSEASVIGGVTYYTVGNRRLSYLENRNATNLYGLREGVAVFDEIKPHQTWIVGSVTLDTPSNNEFRISIPTPQQNANAPRLFDLNAEWKTLNVSGGVADYVEYLKLRNMKDGPIVYSNYETNVVGTKKYLLSTEPKITFNSGDCAGMVFKVVIENIDYSQSQYLTLEKYQDSSAFNPTTQQYGITYPNNDIKPKAGDTFVITDILLPWQYVSSAEANLQNLADERLQELSQPQASYNIQLADDFVLQHYGVHTSDFIQAGKFMHIKDTDLGLDKKIRITSYSRDLLKGYKYDVTVSDFEPQRKTRALTISKQEATAISIGNETANDPTSLSSIFTMTFQCTDEYTLSYYASDGSGGQAYLDAPGLGRWRVNAGTNILPENREYYIFLKVPRSDFSGSGITMVFSNGNDGLGNGKYRKNSSGYTFLLGKTSAIKHITNPSSGTIIPYRTVEMWLGSALNEIPVIGGNGGTIVSPTQSINIDLSNGEVSFAGSNGQSVFNVSQSDGVRLRHAQAGTSEMSVIPCYRGVYSEDTVYNNGDEVIAASRSGYGTTTYRCVAEETTHNPINEDSDDWVPLADFAEKYETEILTYSEEIYTSERSFLTGKTRVYIDGRRLFNGIDYEEYENNGIILSEGISINPDSDVVILEAVFV